MRLQKVSQAKSFLQGLGLVVDISVIGSGDNIVVGQSPGKGALVHEGEHVTLYVLQ